MNEKAPLVTVVMVAYNHAKYLQETMDSVFAQTLAELEIILIDNGSTDNSASIISQMKDPRLKVITQENLGLSLAYNIGIDAARGKWIALGNADDIWMPNKLALQIEALNKSGAGVAFAAAQLIDEDGAKISDDVAEQFSFSFEDLPRAQMYEKFFFKTNFMCATSALISADLLVNTKFDPSLIQLQDYEVWVKLIKQSRFVVLPEKLVGYRVRREGANLSLNPSNRSRVLFELHSVYKRFFDAVEPEFFKQSFGQHFRKPGQNEALGLEFEKAYLFLKMQEPSIRALGLEMIYGLVGTSEGRAIAKRDYALNIADIWDLSKMAIYADSQSIDSAALECMQLQEKLKAQERELSNIQAKMNELTSTKLWKLYSKLSALFG